MLDPQGVGAEVYAQEMRPEAALSACRAAVAAHPAHPRFQLQLARALQAVNAYDAARNALIAAAPGGHIRSAQRRAILEIALQAQRDGMIQQAAPETARAMLESGIAKGDPLAAYTLGRELLRYGPDAEARARGYDLLTLAHAAGYLEAINELGRYFLQSEAHADPDRALRYFEATAARGNINGQNSLGIIYRRGRGGLEEDPVRAAAAFHDAAKGGILLRPTRSRLCTKMGTARPVTRRRRWRGTTLGWTVETPGLARMEPA
ncbi:MAG: tetratricopeptide repeat protein [Pseudomonadota bacterium]